jgi:pimeloyl-ACP methyl ester carboxylesterase
MTTTPTIVFVHGAFADASGWNGAIARMTALGYRCHAPANPLRGVVHDADYVRSFVDSIAGPVVLVGHSYGGCVITNAAAGAAGVQALVYICAFAPEEGERLQDTFGLGGGTTELGEHLVLRPYPGAADGDADAYIAADHFHRLFCADVPADEAALLEAGQRGFAASALTAPSGTPGWRTIPSWYLVGRSDLTIPPPAQRAMAARAGATTVEVDSSHVAMISNPQPVVDLVLDAVKSSG